MRYLSGREEEEAIHFIRTAADVAKNATCIRAKCGSVIVNKGEIIGSGFNSPPAGLESQRRCSIPKNTYDIKVTDKTCCVHAEQRAIMDALSRNPDKIKGSRLYFIRLDKSGNNEKAGKPYCTICSKMALDSGISEFVLWHEKGVCVYDTQEYNSLSYNYKSGSNDKYTSEYFLEINDRPFNAINAGTKKIEVRAPTEHNKHVKFMELKQGDAIIFENNETKNRLKAEVIGVRHYKDARSLLESEGTLKTLSSGGNIEQGIKSINSIPGYEESIKLNGVYAIEIKRYVNNKDFSTGL